MNDNRSQSQLLSAAVQTTTEQEASQIIESLKELFQGETPGLPDSRARFLALDAIGYHGGYCSIETRGRMEELFQTEHPMFGSLALNGELGAGQVFAMGQAMAQGVSVETVRAIAGIKGRIS